MKRDMSGSSTGVIWSHGYPLMQLNSQPVLEQTQPINSRSLQYPSSNHHPIAVSEGEFSSMTSILDSTVLLSVWNFQTNWNTRRSAILPTGLSIALIQHDLNRNRLIHFFVLISFMPLRRFITTHSWSIRLKRTISVCFRASFADMSSGKTVLDLYQRINGLKRRNPKLKTLLGVGGWNMKSYAFSTMIHDENKRRNFIIDSIKWISRPSGPSSSRTCGYSILVICIDISSMD